jgi:hypothetical protein
VPALQQLILTHQHGALSNPKGYLTGSSSRDGGNDIRVHIYLCAR